MTERRPFVPRGQHRIDFSDQSQRRNTARFNSSQQKKLHYTVRMAQTSRKAALRKRRGFGIDSAYMYLTSRVDGSVSKQLSALDQNNARSPYGCTIFRRNERVPVQRERNPFPEIVGRSRRTRSGFTLNDFSPRRDSYRYIFSYRSHLRY